jgi:TonB-dependent starch-binding outer membrane protein SusC
MPTNTIDLMQPKQLAGVVLPAPRSCAPLKGIYSSTISKIKKRLLMRVFIIGVCCGLFLFAAQGLRAQNTIHVVGRVVSDSGQAIAKATIAVKGSQTGVSSDDNGNFELSVPSNATLTISSVGFLPSTVKIGGRVNLQIVLTHSSNSLDQVIVVGYGTQKKSDVTGAVARVTASTLAEVPEPNFINQLQGRTAGVSIVNNSSTPGGGGQIRIRGNRSMATSSSSTSYNANSISDGLDQPLVVLDGIPFSGNVNDIDPDDIASLDILKDASATAIYGSRGSGGVILITTKRGRVGKSQMTYNGYTGISSVLKELRVFNGPEYAQFKADAAALNSTNPGTTAYGLTPEEDSGLAAGRNTDWQKLIYRNAMTTSQNLSLSAGSETTQFGLGASYYEQQGIIPGQKFQRFSLRMTIDHKISSHLKIGLNTINSLSIADSVGGSGVTGTLMHLSPLDRAYNPDGTLNLYPLGGSIDATVYVNPLTLKTEAAAMENRARRLQTFNSLYGEWYILPGLKYRLNVGLNYAQVQTDNYNGPSTFTNSNTSLTSATATVGNTESYTWVAENVLSYDKTFADKHHLTLTGLYSAQKDHTQSSSFTGTGFPANYVLDANLALANSVVANGTSVPGGANFAERGLISYMARANYAFDERFLLTATVRRDGSSVLSPGNQYFTYPALAVGWNIMNENFMKTVGWVSNLKLRGGWGLTSNQGIAPYTTLGALTTSTYNFGQATPGQVGTYLVTSLANTHLHWEQTAQTNIGVDYGFLQNRISGTIDVYEQKTSDILLLETLPASNGASNVENNLGKTTDKGLEINLSTVNIKPTKPGGFSWTTDFNFFLNREKITQLTPGQNADINDGWFVGQPLTVIYDVKKIGIWQTQDSIDGALKAQTSPSQLPGNIKVQDIAGPNGSKPDGKIDANDRQVIGNFQPKWEGGFSSTMTFKGFDFNFVVFARMGMKVVAPYLTTDGTASGYDFFMQSRINQLKVNYWTRTNPTNAFPRPDASLQSFPFASTLGYQNGSFIKMRSINLGYTIPAQGLNKAGITSLRVYVNVLNPFVIYSPFVKDGFGPDPEGNGYGGQVASTAAGGSTGVGGSNGQSRQITVNANNPATRTFNLGVQLKF